MWFVILARLSLFTQHRGQALASSSPRSSIPKGNRRGWNSHVICDVGSFLAFYSASRSGLGELISAQLDSKGE